ncbi:MAG: histidine kinase, partial [Acidobacteriota bacterium]|nr:histidine kinase [Acidobacteriota bacterium]
SDLEIHYTGLSFSAPDKVRFRYRLAGVETGWVDAGERRTAYYTHLPPGRFRFQVAAANADGVWNTTGADIDITVVPSFWQTWQFRALIALAIAGALISVHQRRVHAMEKGNAQRAAYASELITSQEGERQRIAAELHDSLGQTLAIIKNRALMSLQEPRNQTRAIEQMDEIADAASHALDEVREIAFNLRPYQIDQLGLRKSIEIMLAQVAESSEIRFSTHVDDPNGTLSPEMRIHVYRIVQEAVNNVLKHSSATEAGVSIARVHPGMTIQISDNGKGFTPEMEGRPGGFGLNGMAERARMLGGRLSVESAPGQGTVIHVSLPAAAGEHRHA